jgi:hypothetical protein
MGKPKIDSGNQEMLYHGKWYSWILDDDDERLWWCDRRQFTDRRTIKRLNHHLLAYLKNHQPRAESENATASVKPKKKRKPVELEETGQARNGRLWLYDDPKREGEKFYCVLEFVNDRKSGCVTFEVITTRGRASHLFGRKEMTVLLKKISKVYALRYGRKEFLKAISPNVGEKP